MLEYELMYFFIGAPIWNLPVIIASCVGFSRARKGKSPVGAFLIGIIVFAIPVWGEYLGNKRRNTGYLLSEEVIIALVFCAIYLCITLPLAIKKYNRYNNEMVYYCVSCGNDFNADVRDETQAKFKCPKCGAPLVNTSTRRYRTRRNRTRRYRARKYRTRRYRTRRYRARRYEIRFIYLSS